MIFGRNPNRDKNRPQGLQNRRPGNLQDGNKPDRRPQAIIEAGLVGRAVRFSHLPGIFPRIRELGKKFGHFAYMLALIYRAVNLLPVGHAYLNPMNIGKFGVRDVIATAANNIVLKRENADKIAVFVAILLSVVMISIQLLAIGFFAIVGEARAGSFFETTNPTQDVVFIFLDQVFGVAGVFGSGAQALGTPVHAGLHAMLAFYSMAMMVLAVFIVVYYIITVVGEAAVSGTPFGRRFNSVWAPIRLVVALGLLVPIAGGLNSAQFITLYTAKLGSGLATNAWGLFVDEVQANGVGNIFVRPDPNPENGEGIVALVQNVFMSDVCAKAYNKVTGTRGSPSTAMGAYIIAGRTVYNMTSTPNASTILQTARNENVRSLRLVWTTDTDRPYASKCGEVNLSIDPLTLPVADDGNPVPVTSIDTLQTAYIQAIISTYTGIQSASTQAAQVVEVNHSGPRPDPASSIATMLSTLNSVYTSVQSAVTAAITTATDSVADTTFDQIFQGMKDKGWGASGMWYARIGSINSRFGSAIKAGPTFKTGMTSRTAEEGAGNGNWYALWLNGNSSLNEAVDLAREVTTRFTHTVAGVTALGNAEKNWIEQTINWLFGIDHLIDFRTTGSATLDPMVGLMSVGDAMVTKAMWAFVVVVGSKVGALVSGFAGAALGSAIPGAGTVGGFIAGVLIGEALTALFNAAAAFFYIIMILGLGAGFLLFYLLPLMPFIYFFFAVVAWVMEIFEAIVGVPLWALAHLKIDGDGLAGPLATNGYFLLLGIFLRPVLIVFGLIGGYLVFGAAAYYLFSTFDVVVNVVRGGEEVGYLGEIMYTLIFCYLAYNLAIMCFKMVDTVPNAILRWIGQGGATPFSDNRPDPISGSQSLIFAAAGAAQMLRPSPTSGAGARRLGNKLGNGVKGMKSSGGLSGGGGKP